jgi:hypothetical protein
LNDIFVEAHLRDWDTTAEEIAFERFVRRILAAEDAQRKTDRFESIRPTTDRRAA